jgi:hypothetical protein
MVKVNLFLIVILTLISLPSCKDYSLMTKRQNYVSSNLKLDGYYYYNPTGIDSSTTVGLFLYKNGVVLDIGGIKSKDLAQMDKYIKSAYNFQKYKIGWGVLKVHKNEITYETWVPSSGGGFPTVKRTGEILSDTTFIINKIYDQSSRKTEIEKTIYRFRKFSPKPDSTNNFIK